MAVQEMHTQLCGSIIIGPPTGSTQKDSFYCIISHNYTRSKIYFILQKFVYIVSIKKAKTNKKK